MTPSIALQYRVRSVDLGEQWLNKFGTTHGQELLDLLVEHKFISPKIDLKNLRVNWTKNNAIELWYKNERLPGQIRFESKLKERKDVG